MLLVLEDVHWADPSTLDLAVYLAQNLSDRSVVLLATYRADEPSSADRIRRFAAGVRRSGAALVLELGPLDPGEMAALLGDAPPAVRQEIAARSEGNPFFAEELLAAAAQAVARCRRACATCCSSGSPGSTALPRGCCAWPRLLAATSTTPCCAPRRRSQRRAARLASRARSTMASSWPSSRPVASASVTPSWPRRSTPPSSPANAKSCMLGWPKRWRRARRRLSSRLTGRPPAAGPKRLSRRWRRPAKRRPCGPWGSRMLTSSGHWRCGPRCRRPPRWHRWTWPGCAPGLPTWPGRRARHRGPSSWPSKRSISTPRAAQCCTRAWGGTSSPAAAVMKLLLPSSAPSSWCPPSRPRRGAPGRWLRSATG